MNADAGSGIVSRLFAASPDAATAAVYALTWWNPFQFGDSAVKNLMLLMLMEFLVVHSGAFIGMAVLSDRASRKSKTLAIVGFGAFYMLFAGAFSAGFNSWWPALTFLWLLLARFANVWLLPLPRAAEARRMISLWAASVLCYLGAVFVGILAPLPRLGLHSDIVPALGLSGGGLWVEQPHTVIASGLLYFAAMAWSKWAYRPEWGIGVSPAGLS